MNRSHRCSAATAPPSQRPKPETSPLGTTLKQSPNQLPGQAPAICVFFFFLLSRLSTTHALYSLFGQAPASCCYLAFFPVTQKPAFAKAAEPLHSTAPATVQIRPPQELQPVPASCAMLDTVGSVRCTVRHTRGILLLLSLLSWC